MQHWDCFMLKVIGYEMGKGKIRCTSKMGLLRRLFQLREIPHAGLNSNRMVPIFFIARKQGKWFKWNTQKSRPTILF